MFKHTRRLLSNCNDQPKLFALAILVIVILCLNSHLCFSQEDRVPPPPKPGVTTPDPLDVCHDSVDRIAVLLSRFPQLAKQGTPLVDIFSCEEERSNPDEPYSMDSAREYRIVGLLLKYGADPNYRTWGDYPPLGFCRDLTLAELLIKYGAKVDVEYGRKAKYSLKEGIKIIANGGETHRPRFENGTGHTLLFEISYSWPGWNGNGDSSASDSITSRRLAFMRLLLKHGAKPNFGNSSFLICLIQDIGSRWNDNLQNGDTISSANMDLLRTLVDAGSKVNVVNVEVTPLLAAIEAHWPTAVDYLIAKGANVNFRDENSDPILYHAIETREQDVKYISSVTSVDEETPSWASELLKMDDESIAILRSHGAVEK